MAATVTALGVLPGEAKQASRALLPAKTGRGPQGLPGKRLPCSTRLESCDAHFLDKMMHS
jgi:hypothetical protein